MINISTLLSKIADIKSILSLILTITMCVCECIDVNLSDTFTCICLLVVGFYFGENKTK